jgi:hypothetical protein
MCVAGGAPLRKPIRYFVVNEKTNVMHVFGLCRQTKMRSIPIRLFENPEELCIHVGRPLRLCRSCQAELRHFK